MNDMPRYIDADALVEELKSLHVSVTGIRVGKGCLSEIIMEYKKSTLRIVDEQQTADVVEVVRCKDCVHSRPIDNTKSPERYFKDECVVCECEDVVGDMPTVYSPYHFCSYGAELLVNSENDVTFENSLDTIDKISDIV